MIDESKHFASWLGRQAPAMILPNQFKAAMTIADRMNNGDLISVMFHGDQPSCLTALSKLKLRFEEEQYWINESNRTEYPGDEDAARDWG